MASIRASAQKAIRLGGVALALALFASACDGGVELIVEVRTDFEPGREIVAAEARLLDEDRVRRIDVGPGDQPIEGLRISEWSGLSANATRPLEVRLLGPGDELVTSRRVLLDNRESLVVRVPITRTCANVTCPESESCLGGRCVEPECVTGLEPICPAPECVDDGGCADGPCTVGRCRAGVCFSEVDPLVCDAPGLRCAPESGCVCDPMACEPGAECEEGVGCVEGDPPPLLRDPPRGFRTGSALRPESLRPTLRWEPVEGASGYELQVDDDCGGPVGACTFESPVISESVSGTTFTPSESLEVSSEAPRHRRYHWRVRACTGGACTRWSESRYLDVGRPPADFDGDGRPAIAVAGGSRTCLGPRREDLFLLHESGTPREPSVTRIVTRMSDDQHGAALAVGDFDADGFDDLAALAWRTGEIDIYRGGPAGLSAEPAVTLSTAESPRVALVAGDFDGDGFDDLVAADGALFLFRGGATGLTTAVTRPHQGGDIALAGDVDGDGFVDLLASRFSAREALVYRGGPAGSFELADVLRSERQFFAINIYSLGDVDGDGFADVGVALGSGDNFGMSTPPGGANLFAGSREGVAESAFLELDPPVDVQRVPAFGTRAAATRGPEGTRIVLVTPASSSSEGALHRVDLLGDISPLDVSTLASFGASISSVDLDLDGRTDLVVGVPSEAPSGAILVYYAEGDDFAAPILLPAPGRGDCFGAALAPVR